MNSKRIFQYENKGFNSTFSENYILSISLKADGFSFTIFDIIAKKVIYIAKFELNINSIDDSILQKEFSSHDLLKNKYHKINIIFNDQRSHLLPSPFFNEKNILEVSEFNFSISSDESISYDYMIAADAYLLFPVKNSIKNFFKNSQMVDLHHGGAIIIESILHKYKFLDKGKCVFSFLEGNQLEVMVINNKKLLLYNSYYTPKPEDIVFFILSIYDQFNLNPSVHPLLWLGNLPDETETEKNLLKEYIAHVDQERFDSEYFSHDVDQEPLQAFYKSILINVCEL